MTPSQAIAKLQSRGMTEATIAAAAKVGQPTINRIKRGTMRPNWELGDRLVKLAEATCTPARKPRKRVA